MGMIGNYLRVSNEELKEYVTDSSKLEERVYNEENESDPNLMDVEKSWEGIFFLLTGKSLATFEEAEIPLRWTLYTPNEIDPSQDMGYGPATYANSDQTKEISIALNKLSVEELRSRYNGKLMMELGIYPECWDEKESIEYLIENIIILKEFYSKAAAGNQAMIMFLN